MPRSRAIKIATLNVAMHQPHSASSYIDLFRSAFKSKVIVKLGRLHGVMLGSLYNISSTDDQYGLSGEIYRFLRLDPNEPWFNIETRRKATEDEANTVNIPSNLLPHLQVLNFSFDPRKHQFYVVTKERSNTLAPSTAKIVLEKLFEPLVARKLFPPVDVTVMPESAAVDDILAMAGLQTLTIELVRPNADDAEEEQARWMQRLANQKARKIVQRIIGERGEAIEPDGVTIAMANAAAGNGKVVGEGHDAQGHKVVESTTDRPAIIAAEVDPDTESTREVLERLVRPPRRKLT